MKKRILMFTAVAGLLYVSLSSYTNGAAHGGAGNHTGSAGSTASCANGSNCHNTNQSTTTAKIQVIDTVTNDIVTTYTPNKKYRIRIQGNNTLTTTSLSHFGFQASATLASNAQAGSFTPLGDTVHVTTITNSIQLIEHSQPLASTGTNTYDVQFNWTAPATGSGTVTFYAMLNAVNNNDQSGGDYPNAAPNTILTESTTAVGNVAANSSVSVYPNPVINQLQIKMDKAGTYNVSVYDMSGKSVYTHNINPVPAGHTEVINTQAWAAGIYHVVINKDGRSFTSAVVKQ